MPIFECARCNELTYSASPDSVGACGRCGSASHRVFEGSFDHARSSDRTLDAGAHAALVYEDAATIAPFCARFLTDGVNQGQRVMAGVERDLRAAVASLLAPDVEVVVDWREPVSLYGEFDSEQVCAMYEEMIATDPRPMRILAGMDRAAAAGVSAEQLDCYERVAHGIITKHGATVVCVYGTEVLPADLMAIAETRHTLFIQDGVVRRSERFEYAPV